MNKHTILENTGDLHDITIESLRDPNTAKAYLNIALEEYQQDNDAQLFLLALKNIAEAQGGLSKLTQIV